MTPPGHLLPVDAPAGRAAVIDLAATARARLGARLSGLGADRTAWLAEAPLAWAVPLVTGRTRAASLDGIRAALAEVRLRVAAYGPAWEAAYAELLLLALLARVDAADPVATIPRRVWPQAEAGLALLLEHAASAAASGWTAELFEKDVGVAQLQLVPYFGGAGRVERVHPAFVSRDGSARDRLRLALYLRRGYLAGDYWARHQWRGFRDGIAEGPVFRTEVTAMMLSANAHLAGLYGSGWVFDLALRTITPHLFARYELYCAIGGHGFGMAIDDVTRERALAMSKTRRALYEAGEYNPAVRGVFVRRSDMVRWARARNLLAAP